jgi:hypothetical protein
MPVSLLAGVPLLLLLTVLMLLAGPLTLILIPVLLVLAAVTSPIW